MKVAIEKRDTGAAAKEMGPVKSFKRRFNVWPHPSRSTHRYDASRGRSEKRPDQWVGADKRPVTHKWSLVKSSGNNWMVTICL